MHWAQQYTIRSSLFWFTRKRVTACLETVSLIYTVVPKGGPTTPRELPPFPTRRVRFCRCSWSSRLLCRLNWKLSFSSAIYLYYGIFVVDIQLYSNMHFVGIAIISWNCPLRHTYMHTHTRIRASIRFALGILIGVIGFPLFSIYLENSCIR